jgi:hypothetical protein
VITLRFSCAASWDVEAAGAVGAAGALLGGEAVEAVALSNAPLLSAV